MDAKELGNLGERLAAEYLVEKGFKILEKNYKITFGEIDIIARKKWLFLFSRGPIHFVEVKTILRQAQDGFFPEERIDYKKRLKLAGLCQIWFQKHAFAQDHPYQIDAIGVLIDPISKKPSVEYFDNVVEDIL